MKTWQTTSKASRLLVGADKTGCAERLVLLLLLLLLLPAALARPFAARSSVVLPGVAAVGVEARLFGACALSVEDT